MVLDYNYSRKFHDNCIYEIFVIIAQKTIKKIDNNACILLKVTNN